MAGSPLETNGRFTEVAAAYVYQNNGGNWTLMGKISAHTLETAEKFDSKVASDSTTIAVGLRMESSNQSLPTIELLSITGKTPT